MKTALTTQELGLRLSVAPVGVATPIASLRGMSGVNRDNLTAERLGLVFKETLELGETPRMESAIGFPMPSLNPATDVSEVFNHDSRAGLNAPKYRSGQHVVAIPSETLFTSSEASKMPFGTLRTIGLQVTSEAKDSFDNFLLVSIPVKTVIRTNSRAGNSEINPNSLTIGNKFDVGQIDNDMKEELTPAVDKIGCSCFRTHCVDSVGREIKAHLHSTTGSRHTNYCFAPVYLKGMKIVSRRTYLRLGTTNPLTLLGKSQNGFNGFRGSVYRLDMQIRNQVRQGVLAITIGEFLQSIGVACFLLIAYLADCVERLGKLADCFAQRLRLLIRWSKFNSDRSIHGFILPHSQEILQIINSRRASELPCLPKATVPFAH